MWYFTKQFHTHRLLGVSEPLLWDRHQAGVCAGWGVGEVLGEGHRLVKPRPRYWEAHSPAGKESGSHIEAADSAALCITKANAKGIKHRERDHVLMGKNQDESKRTEGRRSHLSQAELTSGFRQAMFMARKEN